MSYNSKVPTVYQTSCVIVER